LCHILDALLQRLSVDEDAIEVRTLSGVDILWRNPNPEARAKLETEIQRWRTSLSLHTEEIARVAKTKILMAGLWVLTIVNAFWAVWKLVTQGEWPTGAIPASFIV